MASVILKETQREALKSIKKATCWDPQQLMVVDLAGNPEVFSKTVDQVTAASVAPSVLVMLNAGEMGKTKEDEHWPNYKFIRKSGGILAQVQFSLQWQEFQGLPSQYPGLWLVTGRGYSNKIVVGVILDSPEMSAVALQDYVAACTEVVRGKLGPEVEMMVYVNKVIEDTQVISSKAMHATILPSASVFSSTSQAMTTLKTAEGAVTVNSSATGCSLCNVGFSRDLAQEDHEASLSHKRNHLYADYQRRKKTWLESPHKLGLQLSILIPENDNSMKVLPSGLVEIICRPHEEKEFRLQLKNNAPNTHQELSETAGLVVTNVGVLRGEEVVELWDQYSLAQSDNAKIRLKPTKKYKVNAKFQGAGIGQLTVPFMAMFYHETRSEMVGVKFTRSIMVLEVLFKVEDDEVRALVSRSPYQQPEASRENWIGRETVSGRQLPKPDKRGAGVGDALEVKLPLGTHRLTGPRRRVIEGRLERCGGSAADLAEFRKCQELLQTELSLENYGERWEFLLHCERHQEDKDIRQFDMSGVQLKIDRTSGLMALEMPGLLEGRPSLIKGDKLYLSNDKVKEYEGFVHSLGRTRVFLGLSPSILTHVRNETFWYVRFHASPYSWDNMHRAVKLCVGSNLAKFLFPKAADLPLCEKEDVVLHYNDDQVSTNPEQCAAISAIVAGRSGRVPYLVFGPPGTGKTVTLVEAIKQVWRLDGETHILACAPSNTAADLLTVRLARHVPADQILRLNALSRSDEAIPAGVRPYSNIGPDGLNIPSMAELSKYRIIVSTLVTAGKLASAVFPQGHFKHVFIDEAGQATEPETCIALAGILDGEVGQLVMAGDPQQLGPLVRSSLADHHGLSVSLMERLLAGVPYTDPQTGNLDPRCVTKLVRNFRSHDSLIALPGKLYYKDELVPSAERALVDNCLSFRGLTDAGYGKTPLLFHGVVGQDAQDYMSPSFFNPEEVVTVVNYIKQLLEDSELQVKEEEIGVISPYKRQCQKIRGKLGESSEVMVGTTEEFQGQERRIIILTTVRSNPDYIQQDQLAKIGFLKNRKRFNVALTRAQALLIVVGNPDLLYQDIQWRHLLDYAQSLGCYKGSPFPRLEERLGRTEARFALQLEEEGRTEDSVEEVLPGAEAGAGVPSQLEEEQVEETQTQEEQEQVEETQTQEEQEEVEETETQEEEEEKKEVVETETQEEEKKVETETQEEEEEEEKKVETETQEEEEEEEKKVEEIETRVEKIETKEEREEPVQTETQVEEKGDTVSAVNQSLVDLLEAVEIRDEVDDVLVEEPEAGADNKEEMEEEKI